MPTVSIAQAQATLHDLIHRLEAGEEVVITQGELPVARLLAPLPAPQTQPRTLGTLRGTVLHLAPDFDAPLADFQERLG